MSYKKGEIPKKDKIKSNKAWKKKLNNKLNKRRNILSSIQEQNKKEEDENP